MDRKTDYRQWDNLCRAFGQDLQLVEEWPGSDGIVVVVDERGTEDLRDFQHPETCTYVFGRTALNDLPDRIPCDHSVRIATLGISLFGVCAASMVLYDRALKNGD